MQVKVGFNTEFGRDKFDVGLDETDLARMLTDEGIPPDTPLTELEVFKILHAAAERFCAAKQAVVEPARAEHWEQETRRLTRNLKAQFAQIKERLGIEQPAAA